MSSPLATGGVSAWAQDWRVEVLSRPPMIAPARQFTYPRPVPGEEDALARGALSLLVYPATGGSFLALCALGFTDPSMPTGIYACPNPQELCAVAGGYAYLINTADPNHATHLPLRPVADVRALPAERLLLFVGFHAILAWGTDGLAWQTGRLSWEGIRLGDVASGHLHGFGWDLHTDREIPFYLDLATGQHQGGGFTPPAEGPAPPSFPLPPQRS